MQNLLFICGKNRLRSPTAERVFADWPDVETASAGVNHDSDNPVTPELLEWASLIFVMEKAHREKLNRKFRQHLKQKKVICLNIPDEYDFMQPELVELLKSKVGTSLG